MRKEQETPLEGNTGRRQQLCFGVNRYLGQQGNDLELVELVTSLQWAEMLS